MTITPSLVTIVNDIARSLGHAGALSDEQLTSVDTLAGWRDEFTENVAAATEAAVAAGHGWSAPQAVWLPFERLDAEPRGLMHTTQTGRLTIMADDLSHTTDAVDWCLAFDFEAGPLPGDREGRVVLSVAWTCRDGRVTFSIDELDATLIAEKPSRVALLMQLAGAAGLPFDDRLRHRHRGRARRGDRILARAVGRSPGQRLCDAVRAARRPRLRRAELEPRRFRARSTGSVTWRDRPGQCGRAPRHDQWRG